MTKLTSVKPTTKQLTLIAAALCSVLGFSTPTYAQELKAKTEPLEQRDIKKPHLDILLDVKKTVTTLLEANQTYSEIIKAQQAEYDLCDDNLCKLTPLEKSAAAYKAYASAQLAHAEAMRDIKTKDVEYIIDTMQIKGDSYLDAFKNKSEEFLSYVDEVLPEIQALNIKSPEDFYKLNSDQRLAIQKVDIDLDSSLHDLTIMMREIEAIDQTRVSYESSKQGFHDHANSYEYRSDKLNAIAFKQTRAADLIRHRDYDSISLSDLNSIATTLSDLPGITDISFIPDIEGSSSPRPELSVIKTKQSDSLPSFLGDSFEKRIESIRNFTRK